MAKIKDIFLEDRPREQAKEKGVSSLNNTQLFALIIGSGVKGFSCLDIANDLLNKFSYLPLFLNLKEEDLRRFKGLSDAQIYRLLAAFELNKRITQILNNSFNKDGYIPLYIASEFAYLNNTHEEKMLFVLYKKFKRIKVEEFSCYNESFLKISLTNFIHKIKNQGADQLVLIHNHINESASPSNEDILSTLMVAEILKECKIKLLDHIIIAEGEYFSFNEEKMIY